MTKVFHPNVSNKGEICVNTLKKDWQKDCGLKHVLMVCSTRFPLSQLSFLSVSNFLFHNVKYFLWELCVHVCLAVLCFEGVLRRFPPFFVLFWMYFAIWGYQMPHVLCNPGGWFVLLLFFCNDFEKLKQFPPFCPFFWRGFPFTTPHRFTIKFFFENYNSK